jgi:ribosomal protein L22
MSDETAKIKGEAASDDLEAQKAELAKESKEELAKAKAEEKPKPKPKAKARKPRAKKAKEEATDDGPQGTGTADDEAVADEPEAPAEEAAEEPKKARKGAEVTAGRRGKTRRPKSEELVTVQARAKYVRSAPRKARLVVDHIRGKSAEEAVSILTHTPRAAAEDVLKLLNSAIANAEANHELLADELRVKAVFVDEGPTIKRFRPRAQGRATRIRKRTSHMTVVLTNEGTE